jgi:hypothetical protein
MFSEKQIKSEEPAEPAINADRGRLWPDAQDAFIRRSLDELICGRYVGESSHRCTLLLEGFMSASWLFLLALPIHAPASCITPSASNRGFT